MAAEKIYKNKLFPVVVGAVLLSIFNAVAVCVVPANGTTSGTDFEPGMQEGLVRSPEPLEFAAVQLNKNIEFSTSIRNLCDEPLDITSIAASCGCADILPAAQTIQPGAEVAITGTIKGRSHPGAISVRATVSLRTRRTKRDCQAEVLITADIVSILTVAPERIMLVPQPSEDIAGTSSFALTNTSKSPVTAQIQTITPLDIDVSVDKCDLQPGQSVSVKLRCSSSVPVASGTMKISVDGDAEEHYVRVVIRPQSSVTLDPETLVLGVVTKSRDGIATSHAPRLTVRGLTDDTTVIPVSFPGILCAPVVTREGTDATVAFGITPDFQQVQTLDPVKLLIVRKQGGSETVSVPLVAFFGEGFKSETEIRP